jgi:hypothetical protein
MPKNITPEEEARFQDWAWNNCYIYNDFANLWIDTNEGSDERSYTRAELYAIFKKESEEVNKKENGRDR